MFSDSSVLETCDVELLGLGICMASRSILNLFNKHLREYDVTMNQVYLLYALAEYRGHNIGFIANKMFMNYKSMMVCIRSMPKYVEIYKDPSDKRALYPALTKEGATFLKEIMPKIIELEKGIGIFAKDKPDFINFVYKFSGEITKNARAIK
jgi:DNA-binding MarR family transcriptional regulator